VKDDQYSGLITSLQRQTKLTSPSAPSLFLPFQEEISKITCADTGEAEVVHTEVNELQMFYYCSISTFGVCQTDTCSLSAGVGGATLWYF